MNPYNFAVLFFAFGAFLLGILIYLKRQDELGKYYLIFSTAAAAWGVFFSIVIGENTQYSTALFSARIANFFSLYIPILWFHIALIITNNPKRKLLKAIYFFAFAVTLWICTPLWVRNVRPIMDFRYYVDAGPVFHLYTFLFVTVTPLGFAELIKSFKSANEEERIQRKGLMFATLAGFVAGLPTFLPCYDISFPQYSLFLMPLYPFAMAYFMTRKNLFNINELVQAARRDKLAAIGTLAASMNHEIRNPLYVIQGLSQSHLAKIKEGFYQTPEEAMRRSEEIFETTIAQSNRAMDIMKSFSTFAKQKVDETTTLEKVDLNQVLEVLLPLINHELALERITFKKEIPSNYFLNVDRRHLEEVLFNLIVNSCQAIKTGAEVSNGEIKLTAHQNPETVILEIQDNGPGIDANKIPKVFEPFYTTKDEGTGLGLYITKQLVERNGGKISVKSKPGKGTCFKLEFKSDNPAGFQKTPNLPNSHVR